MAIERIDLNDPALGFTFSTCVIAGNFIYTSHQAGMVDELGNKLEPLKLKLNSVLKIWKGYWLLLAQHWTTLSKSRFT